MATTSNPNTGVSFTSAGVKKVTLRVTANGLTTTKVVDVVIKPDPTPVPPPVNPYPPDTTYTDLGAVPALPMPAYLQTVFENVNYGDSVQRSIQRITDEVVFAKTNPTHHYSKTQNWNCDKTLMLVSGFILDGVTREVIFKLKTPFGVNFQWSFTDPNVIYVVTNLTIYTITVNRLTKTDTKTLKRDFRGDGYSAVSLGASEGGLSRDNRWVSLMITDSLGVKKVITYDILNNLITASKTYFELGGQLMVDMGVNFTTISPSGNYVIIRRDRYDTGYHRLYDRDLNFLRVLSDGSHASYGFDQAGNEVQINLLPLSFTRFSDGVRTILYPNATIETVNGGQKTGGHTCVAWQRNGWAYISFGSERRELIAFKLDNSGVCERFCFSRDNTDEFASESKGSISPDGTEFVFAAQWAGQDKIYSFLVKRI